MCDLNARVCVSLESRVRRRAPHTDADAWQRAYSCSYLEHFNLLKPRDVITFYSSLTFWISKILQQRAQPCARAWLSPCDLKMQILGGISDDAGTLGCE